MEWFLKHNHWLSFEQGRKRERNPTQDSRHVLSGCRAARHKGLHDDSKATARHPDQARPLDVVKSPSNFITVESRMFRSYATEPSPAPFELREEARGNNNNNG